jgi:hypothetical protein
MERHVHTILSGLIATGVGFVGWQFWSMSHLMVQNSLQIAAAAQDIAELKGAAVLLVPRDELRERVQLIRDYTNSIERRVEKLEDDIDDQDKTK